MKNFIQKGETITVTLSGTVSSGDPALIGAILGVAVKSGVSGDAIAYLTEGVFELAKASGAVTVGAKLYWDATNTNLTTTSSGNTHIGYAWAAAASGDTTVIVKLGI